jgi:hypothetical protein
VEGEINDAMVVRSEIPYGSDRHAFCQRINLRYRGLSKTYFPVTADGTVHAMRLEGRKA